MKTEGKLFAIFLMAVFGLFLLSSLSWGRGSASESYSLPSSVFSCGGSSLGSSNFRATGIIGQPSPLMDPADPPYSDSYDLYPGFWYAEEAGVTCRDIAFFASGFGHMEGEMGYSPSCDFDSDGDVDGMDLATLANGL